MCHDSLMCDMCDMADQFVSCDGSMRGISHLNVTWLIHKCHATYRWVMTYMNESCHAFMSHVTYEEVMSCMNESCHTLVAHKCHATARAQRVVWYGVATISRLLKIPGLFCKRALSKRLYSEKETCNFKKPTNRSHLIAREWLMNTWRDSFIYVMTHLQVAGLIYMGHVSWIFHMTWSLCVTWLAHTWHDAWVCDITSCHLWMSPDVYERVMTHSYEILWL